MLREIDVLRSDHLEAARECVRQTVAERDAGEIHYDARVLQLLVKRQTYGVECADQVDSRQHDQNKHGRAEPNDLLAVADSCRVKQKRAEERNDAEQDTAVRLLIGDGRRKLHDKVAANNICDHEERREEHIKRFSFSLFHFENPPYMTAAPRPMQTGSA